MNEMMYERYEEAVHEIPGFPYAPHNWSQDLAEKIAAQENINLNEDHWNVVRALQEYFSKHDGMRTIRVRELASALDEKFHHKGGLKFLYSLLPAGPVAQGCRLAGLHAPSGSVDHSFGSVM